MARGRGCPGGIAVANAHSRWQVGRVMVGQLHLRGLGVWEEGEGVVLQIAGR